MFSAFDMRKELKELLYSDDSGPDVIGNSERLCHARGPRKVPQDFRFYSNVVANFYRKLSPCFAKLIFYPNRPGQNSIWRLWGITIVRRGYWCRGYSTSMTQRVCHLNKPRIAHWQICWKDYRGCRVIIYLSGQLDESHHVNLPVMRWRLGIQAILLLWICCIPAFIAFRVSGGDQLPLHGVTMSCINRSQRPRLTRRILNYFERDFLFIGLLGLLK